LRSTNSFVKPVWKSAPWLITLWIYIHFIFITCLE
jgi:hypothetical protein